MTGQVQRDSLAAVVMSGNVNTPSFVLCPPKSAHLDYWAFDTSPMPIAGTLPVHNTHAYRVLYYTRGSIYYCATPRATIARASDAIGVVSSVGRKPD